MIQLRLVITNSTKYWVDKNIILEAMTWQVSYQDFIGV